MFTVTVYISVYSKISTEVLYSRNTSFNKIIKDVTYKMTQSYQSSSIQKKKGGNYRVTDSKDHLTSKGSHYDLKLVGTLR